ncbi:MAG: DinB family protein [Dehalococcoidia bacterium]|nr:DinB family protein [Dehalococcoidia bacterium]
MARDAVLEVLYYVDEAFDSLGHLATGANHSLLGNVRSVPDDAWAAVPPGGERSICDIVLHVGGAKLMYDDHAFGAGELTWDSGLVNPWAGGGARREHVLEWLTAAHQRLRGHIAALTDMQLAERRKAHWGESLPARWLISAVIQHDLYHAGEINHIRGVLTGSDGWAER